MASRAFLYPQSQLADDQLLVVLLLIFFVCFLFFCFLSCGFGVSSSLSRASQNGFCTGRARKRSTSYLDLQNTLLTSHCGRSYFVFREPGSHRAPVCVHRSWLPLQSLEIPWLLELFLYPQSQLADLPAVVFCWFFVFFSFVSFPLFLRDPGLVQELYTPLCHYRRQTWLRRQRSIYL